MYTLFVPKSCKGKFYPTVFLDAAKLLAPNEVLRIVSDVPIDLHGWSLLVRLPSIYHLRKQVQVGSPDIPGVFDFVAPYRAAIKQCSARIVLDMGIECFFARNELFQELHDLAEEYGLTGCSITISNGNQLADAYYDVFCAQRGLPKIVEFVATSGGAWSFARSTLSEQDRHRTLSVPTATGLRQKRFISFNGRARPHRFLLGLLLYALGDLERSTVSVLGYDSNRRINSVMLEEETSRLIRLINRVGFSEELLPHVSSFLELLPIEADVRLSDANCVERYSKVFEHGMPAMSLFDEACFHIVSETLFFSHDARFVTEKTFKAVAARNPFLVIGHPGTLRHLRSFGFRTFSPFLDESYDDIEDDLHRLATCLSCIISLSRLSDPEAQNLVANCQEVFEYNHHILRSGRFVERLQDDFGDRILPACFS